MCYSEYYALNRSNTVRQYYDRFCVHVKHCIHRGIDANCQDYHALDKTMQRLFARHHAKTFPKNILHSVFCCCTESLCNSIDYKEVKEKFGLEKPVNLSLIKCEYLLSISSILLFLLLR
ncbi:hypothetical protein WR25_23449 [Diploscapter pachys]|uniref:DUF7773 domain-containing protein n=1 Tax=Diploscapter pachys TaxID=2018661 RepID=A0A2A2KQH4_9BILA|nr:hypothetical protein WR25_23449 [Diploscapter pachys]